MKNQTKYLAILSLLVIIGLLIGSKYHFDRNNQIKYANLEKEIRKIHQQMEADLPKESLEKAEHFGAGLSIRNSYNLWKKNTPVRNEFEKVGVTHPDDMSGIIMETYIREKRGVPFNLHRLTKLSSGFYEAKDKQEYLKKLANEFYIYEQYKKEIMKYKPLE